MKKQSQFWNISLVFVLALLSIAVAQGELEPLLIEEELTAEEPLVLEELAIVEELTPSITDAPIVETEEEIENIEDPARRFVEAILATLEPEEQEQLREQLQAMEDKDPLALLLEQAQAAHAQ